MTDDAFALQEETIFCFGEFKLHPKKRKLFAGDSPVKIGGRAFNLLELLVIRQGQIVSKAELMAAAWPGIYVHDSNLKVNMFGLRKSLEQEDARQDYIDTVPGRGYRFVADVTVERNILRQEFPRPSATALVGRLSEAKLVESLLERGPNVTIVGPGGIGKTTVAAAAASALESRFDDGVCWVDLSTTEDPSVVPSLLASALGLRGSQQDGLSTMLSYLAVRQVLIVMDNCEHVLGAVRFLVDSIDVTSGTRILATSREALGSRQERLCLLPPLSFPDAQRLITLDVARSYSAFELLARRAEEHGGYLVRECDISAISRICQLVDGNPLAIELVAASLSTKGPNQTACSLERLLGHPVTGWELETVSGSVLLSVVNWSFKRLSKEDATVFCLISVFAGWFYPDDLLSIGRSYGFDAISIARSIASLVAKSLIQVVEGRTLKYRMLHIPRRFAAEQLHNDPQMLDARRQHVMRMIELFERAEVEWAWADQSEWISQYGERLADFRSAVGYSLEEARLPELAVRLTVAALPLLFNVSAITEARQRVETALSLGVGTSLQRTKLTSSRAWSMLYARSLDPVCKTAWEDALQTAREVGEVEYELRALVGLAFYLLGVGLYRDARDRMEELVTLSCKHPQMAAALDGWRVEALAKAYVGEIDDAFLALDKLSKRVTVAGSPARMTGFQVDRSIGTRTYLSFVAWISGRPDVAATVAETALQASTSLRHTLSQSNVLTLAGLPVALWNQDFAQLERYIGQLEKNFELEPIDLWRPHLRYFKACVDIKRAEPGALQDLRLSIDEICDTRFTVRLPEKISYLAEVLDDAGHPSDAEAAIDRALQLAAHHQARWCVPELQRVRSRIVHRGGKRDRKIYAPTFA